MKIKDLLSSPDRWCKRAFARDANGHRVDYESAYACKWCLEGAIRKLYAGQGYPIECKLMLAVEKLFPGRISLGGLPAFNDCEETTWDDIKRVLELADV